MSRQKHKTKNKDFDPFQYFGALDMPQIEKEDQPAHPRIENIFKSKKEQEVDDLLKLASSYG